MSKLNKMIGIGLLAALLAAALMPGVGRALAGFEIGYTQDFEKSLDKWLPGSGHDNCITKDTLKLGFEKDPFNSKSALPGKFNGYAGLTDTCGFPIWMLANLTGSGRLLRVEFDTRNLENCESCIALVYAGDSPPKYPGQFTTDFKSLGKSWQKHVITVSAEPVTSTPGRASTVVAIGFANLDTADSFPVQRIGIDNISVTLDSGTPPKTH